MFMQNADVLDTLKSQIDELVPAALQRGHPRPRAAALDRAKTYGLAAWRKTTRER